MATEGASVETRGGATLSEVADALGVSRERVRQIERRALRKCESWCRSRGLELHQLLDARPPGDGDGKTS